MGRVWFYSRAGEQLADILEYAKLFEDDTYRILKFDQVGAFHVSTIWLGLDHGFGLTPRPLIFETMVVGPTCHGDSGLVAQPRRYFTEAEALAGHAEILKTIRVVAGVPAKDERPGEEFAAGRPDPAPPPACACPVDEQHEPDCENRVQYPGTGEQP